MSNSVFVHTGDIENPLLVHWGSDTGLFDADTGEMVGYGFDDLTIDLHSKPDHVLLSNILDEEDLEGLTWDGVEAVIKSRVTGRYDVIGVFTDNDLQPFTYEVEDASGPREAVRIAFNLISQAKTGNGLAVSPRADLQRQADFYDVHFVSVRNNGEEYLHEIEELA